jgi:hypothetical protein
VWETYRMLGEQREAELEREVRRLRAGASVRSSSGRAKRKMVWMPGLIRGLVSVFGHGLAAPASQADVSRLQVDELSVAATEVATTNDEL